MLNKVQNVIWFQKVQKQLVRGGNAAGCDQSHQNNLICYACCLTNTSKSIKVDAEPQDVIKKIWKKSRVVSATLRNFSALRRLENKKNVFFRYTLLHSLLVMSENTARECGKWFSIKFLDSIWCQISEFHLREQWNRILARRWISLSCRVWP